MYGYAIIKSLIRIIITILAAFKLDLVPTFYIHIN